jgi:hypothetical protein
MEFHIHSEFFNKDHDDLHQNPAHIDDVICPTEELADQLRIIGEAIADPNSEFEVGDEVIIMFHLTGLCEIDD